MNKGSSYTIEANGKPISVGKVRGGLVSLRGEILYYEPRANACYLYKYYRDIGSIAWAIHVMGRNQVCVPSESQIRQYLQTTPSEYKNTNITNFSLRYDNTDLIHNTEPNSVVPSLPMVDVLCLPYSPYRVTSPTLF